VKVLAFGVLPFLLRRLGVGLGEQDSLFVCLGFRSRLLDDLKNLLSCLFSSLFNGNRVSNGLDGYRFHCWLIFDGRSCLFFLATRGEEQ